MASSSRDPSERGEDRQRGKRSPRLPTARPAKVNTTWEDQCQLAEVLKEMGVSCKACLQGSFCHESGPSCYKYMISAGTITSTGRTCDLRQPQR